LAVHGFGQNRVDHHWHIQLTSRALAPMPLAIVQAGQYTRPIVPT
jgi:hypothetical protein